MSSKTPMRALRQPEEAVSSGSSRARTPAGAVAVRIGAARTRSARSPLQRVEQLPATPAAGPAAARPRRTQAERSRLTRERVMQATVTLMRQRGYGHLSTVEVSERAGVSRGAMLHQFPTKNDLVLETIRYLNDQMLEASAVRAQRARDSGGDLLDFIIEDAFDFFFGDYFFITLSIGMSDERNEALRQGLVPMVGPSRLQVEQRWVEVLVDAGWPKQQAEDVLALTFGLVRGFVVRRLIQDDRKRFGELMALWKSMVVELVHRSVRPPAGPAPKSGRSRTRG